MVESALLTSMGKKAVKDFREDLLSMLMAGKEMDRYYNEGSTDVDTYMKKFNSLINLFNKKYKNLSLKLVKKVDSLQLKLLVSESDVKAVFGTAASKIVGLQSIGTRTFGTAIVSDANAFSAQLEKAKDKLYISYYNPEAGKCNVFLQYDKKSKKIEIVYDLEDICNEPSAEFQIAAFYALQEFNKKIKLAEEAGSLGFTLWPDHNVKAEYYRSFDPHFTE